MRQGVGVSGRSVRFQGLCVQRKIHMQDSLSQTVVSPLNSVLPVSHVAPLSTAAADAQK